jgi:hypothetical protein
MIEFIVDYGQTDQDCLDVHLFLCVVGGPTLLAPIDAQDSIAEIMRVRDQGVIINARKEGHLIGTMGIMLVPWWYNTKKKFFTNRWWSVLPQFKHLGVGVRLEAEAAAIGYDAGIPVVIMSHAKRRKAAAPTEPYFVRDHVAVATQQTEKSNGLRPNHDGQH